MSKILAFDYGSKRTGVAISDELGIIASPLETIHSSTIKDYVKSQIEKNRIEILVMGLPKDLKGENTDATKQVLDLEKHLKKTFPNLTIYLEDERFTSKIASRAMIEGNMPKAKRRVKGNLDKISAALILQSFLERKKW